MAQTFTIRLSDIAVKYLQQVAELTQQPVDTIIEQSLTHSLLPLIDEVPQQLQKEVYPLLQMDVAALKQEMLRLFPANRWEIYEKLLDKKKNATLTSKEQAQLDKLSHEADVLAFRKAYAAVLLKRLGYRIPSANELPLPQ
ncbi:MAG: hypothetical protein U0175_03935 [Caldilineaceae bacterium]